jgi:nucleoside-diphosphate-sugar epimerase
MLVRRLSEHGHEVTVKDRQGLEADLDSGKGSFASASSHGRRTRHARVQDDVAIDLAPYRSRRGDSILKLSELGRRLVLISSCDVYRAFSRLWMTEPGPLEPLPLTEESPLRSEPLAANRVASQWLSSIDVERVARTSGLPVTILRLAGLYGPGDQLHRFFRYVKPSEDQRSFILLEEHHARWRWSRIFIENVVAAIALSVEATDASGRIYNVAEPDAYSESEWARRIGDVMGWPGEIVALPERVLPAPLRPNFDYRQHFVIDSTRIRRELGYTEVINETDALRAAIDWELRNPPDPGPALFYDEEDQALDAYRSTS